MTGTVSLFLWVCGVTASHSFSSPAAVLSHCGTNRQADLSVTQLLGAERNAVREHGEPSPWVKQLDNDAAPMFRFAIITRIPPKVNSKVYIQLNSNQIHTKKTFFLSLFSLAK